MHWAFGDEQSGYVISYLKSNYITQAFRDKIKEIDADYDFETGFVRHLHVYFLFYNVGRYMAGRTFGPEISKRSFSVKSENQPNTCRAVVNSANFTLGSEH